MQGSVLEDEADAKSDPEHPRRHESEWTLVRVLVRFRLGSRRVRDLRWPDRGLSQAHLPRRSPAVLLATRHTSRGRNAVPGVQEAPPGHPGQGLRAPHRAGAPRAIRAAAPPPLTVDGARPR